MSTVALVRSVAPALSSFTDDQVTVALAEASAFLDVRAFGGMVTYALAYYAAHLLALQEVAEASGPGTSGAVIARRTGDLSEAFLATGANPTTGDYDLASTIYGRRFIHIRNSRAATAPFVVKPRT